ncbi:MAG: hypothetical protein ACI31R_02000 [Bacilli bacterium]
MKEINFTEDELKETLKGNYVASGSEASIYKYKDNIAIRLYDVGDSVFCPVTGKAVGRPQCETLVKNLHVYKDNIKLSSFPIGIVKVNDIVVGQLIKYYKNSITLTEFFKSSPSIDDPIHYYLKVLDILEELAVNGICYEDVHGGNFLIVGNKFKIIDFSEYRMKIKESYKGAYYNMFQNFNTMVNNLNFKVLKLDDVYDQLVIPSEIKNSYENLEESFDYIREQLKNLKKDKSKTR